MINLFTDKWPYTDFHELNADWIVAHFKEFIDQISNLNEWRSTHEKEYAELKKLYDNIMAGNFPESMIKELEKWCIKNTTEIIGAAIKTVFFELTDDGYLIAYIPDNWNEITFGTSGLDVFPSDTDFGHLTLTY